MAKGNIDSVSLEALGIGNNSQYINSNMNVNLITNSDSGTINNISGTPNNGNIEPIKTDGNTNVLLNEVGFELENSSKGELSVKTKEFLKEEFDKENNKMFTLFGIFASVVAFLLVEVQVLKTATSSQTLMGLSLIILGALSFFVLLIKVVLLLRDDFKYEENKLGIIIVSVLLIASFLFIKLGVCFASQGNEGQIGTIKYEKNFYSDIKYH